MSPLWIAAVCFLTFHPAVVWSNAVAFSFNVSALHNTRPPDVCECKCVFHMWTFCRRSCHPELDKSSCRVLLRDMKRILIRMCGLIPDIVYRNWWDKWLLFCINGLRRFPFVLCVLAFCQWHKPAHFRCRLWHIWFLRFNKLLYL